MKSYFRTILSNTLPKLVKVVSSVTKMYFDPSTDESIFKDLQFSKTKKTKYAFAFLYPIFGRKV